MLIYFSKMHALGNDFVVIDLITQHLILNKNDIQRLTNRHTGIGCDQLLLIDPPIRREADFSYRIFNQDGSEAEQCGNGVRCLARFFYDVGLGNKTHLLADCLAGSTALEIKSGNSVSVNMGFPIFIPFSDPTFTHMALTVVSLGNPHAIITVPDIDAPEIPALTEQIRTLSPFALQGINVGFMHIVNRSSIRLRVFERGSGETFSCGSGACAAVIAGHQLGLLDSKVTVGFRMGALEIQWNGIQNGITAPIFMRGPTIHVFTGQFRL